jgi:hypothetical protein
MIVTVIISKFGCEKKKVERKPISVCTNFKERMQWKEGMYAVYITQSNGLHNLNLDLQIAQRIGRAGVEPGALSAQSAAGK